MSVAAGARIYASDINYLYDRTTSRPVCRLIKNSSQSLSDNTSTAITFGSGTEDIDTHGMHNESSNTSRVTPTIAGVYRVVGTVAMEANADYSSVEADIGLNGTIVAPRTRFGPNATASARASQVTALVNVNGTTDYIELYATQDDSGTDAHNALGTGTTACTLEVTFLRDAP